MYHVKILSNTYAGEITKFINSTDIWRPAYEHDTKILEKEIISMAQSEHYNNKTERFELTVTIIYKDKIKI